MLSGTWEPFRITYDYSLINSLNDTTIIDAIKK